MNQALENEEVLEELQFFDNPWREGYCYFPLNPGWLFTASHHVMTAEVILEVWSPEAAQLSPHPLKQAPSVEPLAATSAAQLP